MDERIDVYITRAMPFAQDILERLRMLVHKYCPDVKENIKWGCPHFEYNGRILFSMAAFKQHCACGFRLAGIMSDPDGILQSEDKTAMGSLGRIASVKDLPPERIFAKYLKEAMQLTDMGVSPAKAIKEIPLPGIPAELAAAFKKSKKAMVVFEKLSPSHRKEYIEWIGEAKKQETRERRVATAIEWLEEGKPRNSKYER